MRERKTRPESTGRPGGALADDRDIRSMPLDQVRDLACELRACQLRLTDQNEDTSRAHAELKDTLARYQELFDRAPVAYLTLVPECEIRAVNHAAVAMFGAPESELVGSSLSELVLPKDVARFSRHMNRVCHENCTQSQELTFTKPDGGSFVACVESIAVRDASGQPRQCRMAMIDVTERVKAQAELQHSERLLRTIIDATGEAMISVGAHGLIELFNSAAERMFGYRRAEMVGAPIERLISQRFRADDLERMGDCFAVGRSESEIGRVWETTGMRRDGTEFPVELMRTVGRSDDGPFVIAIARDLTERKRAEQERRELDARLQEAQRLESLGTLAGGVAHDFSNLLVGVLGNASLAMDEVSPNSPVWQLLSRIERAARSAADLTRQLQAYSGRGSFVIAPVDVSVIVREMTHLLRSSVSRRAELGFELANEPLLIQADASQVRQVILNLAVNASESFGEKSGSVTIRTGVVHADNVLRKRAHLGEQLPAGQCIAITVTDTGCGMDERTKSRVFDPFFTTKFTGRGLGLAAVLGIARSHGGAVDVESRPGSGTSVTVLFPCCGPQGESTDADTALGSRGVVLVVDDEETVRQVASAVLKRNGYDARCTSNGREALDVFGKDPGAFAAVLLDLTMPELDGEETIRELRRLRPDIPVILSSGYEPGEVMERLEDARPTAFIRKPYSAAALIDQIRAILAH